VSSASIQCWELREVGVPLARAERAAKAPSAGEAVVRVAGCGVCHTDLGYAVDGVSTRHGLPLTLGHEIAGIVEQVGPGAEGLLGKSVVVPAVIPCGRCSLCESGHEMICRAQVFPGCDVHGGFASQVTVPAHGLCEVDPARLEAQGLELWQLAAVGDAVSTAYHAVNRSGLVAGELAIVVGAGGVGGFAVQVAAAQGAQVVAIDVDDERLNGLSDSLALGILAGEESPREVRNRIRVHAKENDLPTTRWRILECSGTKAGQELAYGLLVHGASLGVVGYTMEKVTVRLSNLMAFDARAIGSWGCPPSLYPAVLELILDGRVKLSPFVRAVPMSRINEVFTGLHSGEWCRRPILIPDFEESA
jgi:6-hydroxycyclohex-1-ene-1-carbonyl-CoA dehydrogenase